MNKILLLFALANFFVFSSFSQISVEDNPINKNKIADSDPKKSTLISKVPEINFTNSTSKNAGVSDESWSGMTLSCIRNEEYNISYSEDAQFYQAPNRANNIRFIFQNNGFTAKTRQNKVPTFDIGDKNIKDEEKTYHIFPEWELKLKVDGFSKDSGPGILFTTGEMIVEKNTAFIEDGNLRIEYNNDENGMRQNFIIKNKPDGNDKLRINLTAETKLNITINNEAVTFMDNSGNEQMKYSSIKVWDANGKELNAYFDNSKYQKPGEDKNSETKIFFIVVNDDDAVYPITVDPISTSPNWISQPNQAEAGYGWSVSNAGDVNNDGFDDVIIGAPFFDNGQTDEGKAFLYYGSAVGLLPVAVWTAEGNQTSAHFGWSVSTAGDVNNDGFSDVIVGASTYTNDQSYEGRAYVYYGSLIGPSLTANKTLESNLPNANFGASVASAGDVNNDGFSDLIVGAPVSENGKGRAFIYYGSVSGPPTNPNVSAISSQDNANFGASVSPAGDINGDGYDDLIIGANIYDNPQRDQGCVFIYFGSASGISLTSFWKSGSINAWFSYLGTSVCKAGDVNGDGFDDIVCGATGFDNGMITDEGKAFVYYGSPTGLSQAASWTSESYQVQARFGNAVAAAGDVNNDGYADVLVGSYLFDNGHGDEGKVYLYYGSPAGLTPNSYWTVESNQANGYFGNAVSTAGDVNGDGYSDILIGSYLYDNGQLNEGSAFVYYGATGGPKVLDLKVIIEGLYNATSGTTLTDSISVNLRSSLPPFAVVDFCKSKINSSGQATLSFNSAQNGTNYYIEVKHKNSVTTWSAAPQSFTNYFKAYSFKSASSQAFGHNMVQVDASPVTYAIYSGDINQDKVIELEDILFVNNDASSFHTGAVNTDLNGDLVTDLTDLLMTSNNAANFVNVRHP